jgi:hypothetical protein
MRSSTEPSAGQFSTTIVGERARAEMLTLAGLRCTVVTRRRRGSHERISPAARRTQPRTVHHSSAVPVGAMTYNPIQATTTPTQVLISASRIEWSMSSPARTPAMSSAVSRASLRTLPMARAYLRRVHLLS